MREERKERREERRKEGLLRKVTFRQLIFISKTGKAF